MTISLAQANIIALAALEAGRNEGILGLTAVVTDPGGHIRCAMRGDEAGNYGIDITLAKAQTALGLKMSSAAIANIFAGNAAILTGLAGATGGRFLALGGAVLVHDAAGTLLGAAAVAGSSPEKDEECAVAGVAAAGLETGK
jgi:uncharacterized protein GlcG (DUF336 family)